MKKTVKSLEMGKLINKQKVEVVRDVLKVLNPRVKS